MIDDQIKKDYTLPQGIEEKFQIAAVGFGLSKLAKHTVVINEIDPFVTSGKRIT